MMMASIVIFTTFFGWLFLNRKLYAYHFFSVGCTCVGLFMIAVS